MGEKNIPLQDIVDKMEITWYNNDDNLSPHIIA